MTMKISSTFDTTANCVLFEGNCLDLYKQIPDGSVKLIVTSPPYNLGKPYETRLDLQDYLDQQKLVIEESVRVLDDQGSICWQVGNYVNKGEIVPLDIVLYPIFASLGLKLRNRM
jgi:DNA modification methylase